MKKCVTPLLILLFIALSIAMVSASDDISVRKPFISVGTMQPTVPDSITVGNLLGFMPYPDSVLFPHFLADPSYPRFGIHILNTRVPALNYKENMAVGDDRIILSMGGKKSFFRIFPAANPDLGVQLEIGFGFNSMVDTYKATDFIAWDGVMHMTISARPVPWLAMQFGRFHVSSHRADEFLDNADALYFRNYVRDSMGWGAMIMPTDTLRFYAKWDESFFHRPRELEPYPFKLEAGFELDNKDLLGGDWTLAFDAQFFEESNWEGSYSLQLSRHIDFGDRLQGVRVGLTWYMGRVLMYDFFELRESYVGVGLWVDSPSVF